MSAGTSSLEEQIENWKRFYNEIDDNNPGSEELKERYRRIIKDLRYQIREDEIRRADASSTETPIAEEGGGGEMSYGGNVSGGGRRKSKKRKSTRKFKKRKSKKRKSKKRKSKNRKFK